MNSKVLASGIVTVNRWYPVAYRGYPQREIFNYDHFHSMGHIDDVFNNRILRSIVEHPVDKGFINF